MNTFKNALIEYPLKENISVQTYEGYNSLHIDLMYKEETIIWLNLDKENKLKICKIKEAAQRAASQLVKKVGIEPILSYRAIARVK